MTQTWCLYILRCADDTLYTGITNALERRLQEHREQGKKCAKYLRGKAPLQLVFTQTVDSRSQALKLESFIKNLPRIEKESIIKAGRIDEQT